jgi:uncharacterized membrane protein
MAMEVQNVYQDAQGKWHIDYGAGHLMGLAIRVYFGQLLIGLIIAIPVIVLSVLIGVAVGKSLAEESNTSQKLNSHNESVCTESSR